MPPGGVGPVAGRDMARTVDEWTSTATRHAPDSRQSTSRLCAMTEATERILFISYATEDAALAQWLTLKLTAAGYRVWCDRVKLLGGESTYDGWVPLPLRVDVQHGKADVNQI